MAKDKDFVFKEVSAKDGTAINDLFYVEIFDQISKKYGLGEPEDIHHERMNSESNKNNKDKKQTLKINNLNNKDKKKKKCCK